MAHDYSKPNNNNIDNEIEVSNDWKQNFYIRKPEPLVNPSRSCKAKSKLITLQKQE